MMPAPIRVSADADRAARLSVPAMAVEVHVTGRVQLGRYAEYARVAAAMPFVEGTLAYELFREE